MSVVLGIDPGLNAVGYAVIAGEGRFRLLEGGEIRTLAQSHLEFRLLEIYQGVRGILASFGPDVVVVEDLYNDYRYPKAAVLMGHARGACLLAAAELGKHVISYSPARIKKALTGRGGAGKAQVAAMVGEILGLTDMGSEHVADAAATALAYLTMPILVQDPAGGGKRN